VPDGPYRSGAEPKTTNQRMEITAVLQALEALPGAVHVLSDSTYVVHCFRDGWWQGWLRRGWLNSQRKPVANRDLWEPLVDLYRRRAGEITFEWVKGHAEDPANDLVDRLAVEAARTQSGRQGTGTPSDVGFADIGGRDPRLGLGHLIAVTGHRPPELGGYGDNPVSRGVRERLTEILSAKKTLHPDAVVLTGLGLGAEQLAAEAAAEARLPYVAVLAFPDQESVWPEASQRSFRELLERAERTVQLGSKRPATPQQAGAALARRDAWMADQADEAVVVWDGTEARLGRTVRSWEERLADDLWVLDPKD
jgi:ribonuclease HI